MFAMFNRDGFKPKRILMALGALIAIAGIYPLITYLDYRSTAYRRTPYYESLSPDQKKKFEENIKAEAQLNTAVHSIISRTTGQNLQQSAKELRQLDGVASVDILNDHSCLGCRLYIKYKTGDEADLVFPP